MAIKGLVPTLAERGKIKIGEKGEMKQSQGGKQFAQPKKLDHFVITTMQRDAAGRLMEDKTLTARLNPDGHKLIELPVRLLYDDIDLNFLTRYSAYQGTRCWCSGDGEFAARWEQGESSGPGKYGRVPCPCEHIEATYTGSPKCKPLGTLQVLLEKVDRVGGVWKFRTTSWNTVNAILSSLALIKTITGGPLAGIPLMMVLSPKTVTVPTTGQNMVVYVVSLEYRGPEEQLAELGYTKAKQRIERQIKMETVEHEARRLLISPHQETPLEQQETAEEFYPEGVTAEIEKDAKATQKPAAQTSQNPPGEKKGPSLTTTQDPGPEVTATATTQSQGVKKGSNLTLPEVMEACKAQQHVELPVDLRTSKNVQIGQWMDRFFFNDEPHLVFEMRPDLAEVAQGLTQAEIARSFKEGGFGIRFQDPGTERAGDEDLPPGAGSEFAPPTVPPEQAQAKGAGGAGTANGRKGPAKALF